MGPSQICGCPVREPRVFEIAPILPIILYITIYFSHFFGLAECFCHGNSGIRGTGATRSARSRSGFFGRGDGWLKRRGDGGC